jgi:hypothetical protein
VSLPREDEHYEENSGNRHRALNRSQSDVTREWPRHEKLLLAGTGLASVAQERPPETASRAGNFATRSAAGRAVR